VRHLFNNWPQVVHRFEARSKIALFLDFDGTLVPIQDRPEDVWLDSATRRTLSRLVRSPRFRVWIVTGRRRADVRARVRVPGIRYLGLHGWEGRAAGTITEEAREAVACAKSWLASLLLSVPGIWLEDKGLTLAIHYQSVTEEGVRKARKLVYGVLAPFDDTLHLIRGKRVWELAPREMGDKGVAVARELSAAGSRVVPVFIGDDLMDEPAFSALACGVTVRVGRPCRTHARYRLSSVEQVHQFLERLEGEFA
jgi:trehalose 6-phosphate phosphatase